MSMPHSTSSIDYARPMPGTNYSAPVINTARALGEDAGAVLHIAAASAQRPRTWSWPPNRIAMDGERWHGSASPDLPVKSGRFAAGL